jgi:hypothetical protein
MSVSFQDYVTSKWNSCHGRHLLKRKKPCKMTLVLCGKEFYKMLVTCSTKKRLLLILKNVLN